MADEHIHCSRDIQRCGARSYLELLIDKKASILEGHLAHERELRLTAEERQDEARELQATEYSRRLEILNHENARVAAAQAVYISREIFDNSRREEQTWRADVQARIERTASALPQYITRDIWEAAQQADRVWKSNVSELLAHNKGASERSMAFITVGLAVLAIALRFIP